ncbi:HNH endonuclease [Sphingobacterium sp. MYb382]|uniref:HNH endonuclease n=1 Tax=Sphingobacterium sp. MYb382 TaxID=2745278 RepID=UPI00309D6E8D
MIKLDLPIFSNAVEELRLGLIGKRKQYNMTLDEEIQVKEIYDQYELSKGQTQTFLKAEHLDVSFRDAIQLAYKQVAEGKRLEKLRARILLDTQDCTCCGLVGSDTIDHYLPQEDYPVLAVYSSNLIPLCQKCNNKKRSVDGSIPGKRFVHAYYDNLPDNVQFLIAKVAMKEGALMIDFEIDDTSPLDSGLLISLNYQLNRVDFYKRAKRQVNDFLGGLAVYIEQDYHSDKTNGVKTGLERNYHYHLKNSGINNWKTVLFQELMNCTEFCEGGFYTALNIEISKSVFIT